MHLVRRIQPLQVVFTAAVQADSRSNWTAAVVMKSLLVGESVMAVITAVQRSNFLPGNQVEHFHDFVDLTFGC